MGDTLLDKATILHWELADIDGLVSSTDSLRHLSEFFLEFNIKETYRETVNLEDP